MHFFLDSAKISSFPRRETPSFPQKKNVPAGKFRAGTFFFSGRELHAFLRRRDAASASANAPAIKPNADGSGMTNPPCSEEKLPV